MTKQRSHILPDSDNHLCVSLIRRSGHLIGTANPVPRGLQCVYQTDVWPGQILTVRQQQGKKLEPSQLSLQITKKDKTMIESATLPGVEPSDSIKSEDMIPQRRSS
jgi:hypothetical protein